MEVIIGSARHNEHGNYTNGKKGDNLQKNRNWDICGEVSFQSFYEHSKGWVCLRCKDGKSAKKIAASMITACNNPNVGYDQSFLRYGVIVNGTASKVRCGADCSSLVRQCVKEGLEIDLQDFTTETEVTVLLKTGKFKRVKNISPKTLRVGDILVTKTKGHTAIVVMVKETKTESVFYPKYTGNSASIVDALKELGVKSTLRKRKKIAAANGVSHYSGKASENTKLINLLKKGKLKRG